MKDVLRKTLALLLCLCMCLSLIPAAFSDDGIELARDDTLSVPGIEEVVGDDAYPQGTKPGDPEKAAPTADETAEEDPSDDSVGADALIVPQTEEDAAAPDEAETSDELAKDNIPNDADEAEILIPGSIRDDDTFEAVSASESWGNLTWTLDSSGTLTISGSGPMKDFGDNSTDAWRSYSDSIKQIVIEDDVTSIGEYAFYFCYNLTSVTIPDSVNSIGSSAFEWCLRLTKVTIPEGVTSIGGSAFRDCRSLTSVHINSLAAWCDISFGSYDSNPLYYAHNLYLNDVLVENLVIPEGRLTIKDYAFDGCTSLTSVTIPDSVTSIGSSAFSGCSSLTSVHINSLAAWCDISFGNHESNPLYYAHNLYLNDVLVENLVFPEGRLTVKDYAFYGCGGLTSVTIPDGVASIGDYAFAVNYNLQTIVFPATLKRIGSSAFIYCLVSDIYYNGNDQDWDQVSKDDACLQGKIHYEKTYPIIIEQHFPDPVFQEYIRRFDEDKNGTLTEGERAVVRTIDVSRLGIGTLEGIEYFPQLTELICGNNNLTALDVSVLPNLTSLHCAFNQLTSLDVSQNPQLTELICGNNNLTALDVSVLPNLTSLHCDFNQLSSLDVSQNPRLEYLNCDYNQLETLNFGGTDQLIELSCSGNQLSDLQLTAFSSLKKLYCGWNQITGLDLSQNSALINLFVNNNSLETLDLSGNPDLLCLWCWGNKIETLDVSGCRELSGSVLSGNIEKYRDSITYYRNNLYRATDLSVDYDTRLIVASGSWDNLTWTLDSSGTLTISGSGPMKDFGDNSTDAWRSYSGSIKQIVIEDGVTSIGEWAFYGCSSLTSVTIPDSVTSIGKSAFSGCSGLTDVFFGGTKETWDRITVGSDNDPLTNATNATIHFITAPARISGLGAEFSDAMTLKFYVKDVPETVTPVFEVLLNDDNNRTLAQAADSAAFALSNNPVYTAAWDEANGRWEIRVKVFGKWLSSAYTLRMYDGSTAGDPLPLKGYAYGDIGDSSVATEHAYTMLDYCDVMRTWKAGNAAYAELYNAVNAYGGTMAQYWR